MAASDNDDQIFLEASQQYENTAQIFDEDIGDENYDEVYIEASQKFEAEYAARTFDEDIAGENYDEIYFEASQKFESEYAEQYVKACAPSDALYLQPLPQPRVMLV